MGSEAGLEDVDCYFKAWRLAVLGGCAPGPVGRAPSSGAGPRRAGLGRRAGESINLPRALSS
ncbi:hypothetical protein KIF24_03660 [Micromonospora sp. Llam7]|uniref:hypothetical protein n=1 Tax=Micromonospora tarapacensis TaxID=2835305 RepID=UPI001C82C908|nr:hypothetical protein [Micromonospora tarapacensis]MBX7265239.1 hypothetical protein [Micromonospora tarapacensis]